MKIPFYDVTGEAKGEREYAMVEFEGDRGLQVLKEVILAYRANARQGNACTKTRGDVKGSGKKPFRQKGTGMARQGEKRSPLARGGGVVFGPKPRDFSVRLNRKEKRLALQRALFDSVEDMICRQFLDDLEVPVAFGFPSGHGVVNYPLLMGTMAKLEVFKESYSLSWP